MDRQGLPYWATGQKHTELYLGALPSLVFEIGTEVDTYLVAVVATAEVQLAGIGQVNHRR